MNKKNDNSFISQVKNNDRIQEKISQKLPKTGDHSSNKIFVLVGVMVISVVIGCFVVRRRKNKI